MAVQASGGSAGLTWVGSQGCSVSGPGGPAVLNGAEGRGGKGSSSPTPTPLLPAMVRLGHAEVTRVLAVPSCRPAILCGASRRACCPLRWDSKTGRVPDLREPQRVTPVDTPCVATARRRCGEPVSEEQGKVC